MNTEPQGQCKCITYNVDGLSKEKFEELFKQVLCDYDVIVLLETFANSHNQYVRDDYVSYTKIRKRNLLAKRNSGGILIMIRKNIDMHFKVLKSISEDILWLRCTDLFLGGDIIIGGIYCSPINSSATDGNFYNYLERDIYRYTNQYPNDKLVLLGDFNSRTGNMLDIIGEYDEHTSTTRFNYEFFHDQAHIGMRVNCDAEVNTYGINLINLCQEFSLCIANGRTGNDANLGNFTCITHNGASVVDYAIVSHSFLKHVLNFEVLETSDFSIHFPLVFELRTREIRKSITCYGSDNSKPTYNLDPRRRYKWKEQNKDIFLNRLEHRKNDLDLSKPVLKTDIERSLSTFYDTINECAGDMLNVCKPIYRVNNTKVNAPFFDEDCVSAKTHMSRTLRLFRKAGKKRRTLLAENKNTVYIDKEIDEKLSEFQVARHEYKKIVKEKKKTFIHERELLAQSFYKNNNEFWNFYKSNNKSKENSVPKESVHPDEWVSYMEALFSETRVNEAPNSTSIDLSPVVSDTSSLDCDISAQEIDEQIQRLGNKKSPGPDGLCSQLLKVGKHLLLSFVLALFNCILLCGYYPLRWSESLVFMLHKKGERSDPNNYRSISLLNIISKLFTSILQKRLYSWCVLNNVLSENQFGFRPKRSTIDCLFIHNTLIQYHLVKKRGKLFVCYIDFSKAFDTVSWEILWRKLEKLGIKRESRFLKILKAIYKIVTCRVITPWGLTPNINICKGVRQGCILSPLLFTLFIDDIKAWLDEVNGHEFNFDGSTPLTHLLFADDLALFSQSVIGLQKMINCLSEYCETFNMKINVDKTKIMVFRKGGRPSKKEVWHLDGNKVEVVSKFKYLGLKFSNSGVWTAAEVDLANRGKKGIFCIKNFLYNSKISNIKIALKLFDACIAPTLNYGAEIWGFHRGNSIDMVSDNFYKYITRLSKNTNNIAARGELGRSRSHCARFVKAIKYWTKLVRDASQLPLYLKLAYELQCKLDSRGYEVWVSDVRNILCSLGFAEEWYKQQVCQPNVFLAECKKRLIYLENVSFMKGILNTPRLIFYQHNKFKLEAANYWNSKLPFHMKTVFCRFLCSGHNLAIETGRRTNTPREARVCCFCNLNEVEDEVHFVLRCPRFHDLRTKYIPHEYVNMPGLNAMVSLIIHPEKRDNVIRFCFYASKKRDAILSST